MGSNNRGRLNAQNRINTMKPYLYLLRIHKEIGSKLFSILFKRRNMISYTMYRPHQITADQLLGKNITSPDIRPKQTLKGPENTMLYNIQSSSIISLYQMEWSYFL